MKKYVIIIIILMNIIVVDANSEDPTYTIIAASNSEQDIKEAYDIKNKLLGEYMEWAKGVDDVYQVLADHTSNYDATFYNGEYVIQIGQGKGKTIEGTLQTNYCSSSQDIQKKSWFFSLFS